MYHSSRATPVTKPPQTPAAGTLPTTVYQGASSSTSSPSRNKRPLSIIGCIHLSRHPPFLSLSLSLSVYLCFHQSVSEGGDGWPPRKDTDESGEHKSGQKDKVDGSRRWPIRGDARENRESPLVAAYTCIGTVPFYFRSRFPLSLPFSFVLFHFVRLFVCARVCTRVFAAAHGRGREDEQSHRNASHYLSPIAWLIPRVFNAPFLFAAVDGISRQLELDLSNPRAIAPRPLFSPSFHALLPPSFSRSTEPRGTALLLLPRFRILGFPARLGGAVAPHPLAVFAPKVEQLNQLSSRARSCF